MKHPIPDDHATPGQPLRRRLLQGSAAALALPWRGLLAADGAAPAPGPLKPRALRFPRDHGSHNDSRTEWWYLTGQASDASGRAFGFQVTFFRRRIDGTETLQSRLAARHLLMAHAAITDVQSGRLFHEQRIARWNGLPPAQPERSVFASEHDTHIRLRDWRLERETSGAYATYIDSDTLHIALQATPRQPWLLQGDQGFSRKGPDPAQASFYISHPQLAVKGRLGLGSQRFDITGTAWLDHEWSESLLHPEAVGWDWIGINLNNGDSLTAFQLRRADGSALWAGGSFRANGSAEGARFQPTDLEFTPQRHWTSPRTGARYPVEWRLSTPAPHAGTPARTTYTLKAVIDPQELDAQASTGTVYWEGLSDLFDSNGQRVGHGYLEMTGYARRLAL